MSLKDSRAAATAHFGGVGEVDKPWVRAIRRVKAIGKCRDCGGLEMILEKVWLGRKSRNGFEKGMMDHEGHISKRRFENTKDDGRRFERFAKGFYDALKSI
jgi:hypothetical protein